MIVDLENKGAVALDKRVVAITKDQRHLDGKDTFTIEVFYENWGCVYLEYSQDPGMRDHHYQVLLEQWRAASMEG